jgi:hypothetical protein
VGQFDDFQLDAMFFGRLRRCVTGVALVQALGVLEERLPGTGGDEYNKTFTGDLFEAVEER